MGQAGSVVKSRFGHLHRAVQHLVSGLVALAVEFLEVRLFPVESEQGRLVGGQGLTQVLQFLFVLGAFHGGVQPTDHGFGLGEKAEGFLAQGRIARRLGLEIVQSDGRHQLGKLVAANDLGRPFGQAGLGGFGGDVGLELLLLALLEQVDAFRQHPGGGVHGLAGVAHGLDAAFRLVAQGEVGIDALFGLVDFGSQLDQTRKLRRQLRSLGQRLEGPAGLGLGLVAILLALA